MYLAGGSCRVIQAGVHSGSPPEIGVIALPQTSLRGSLCLMFAVAALGVGSGFAVPAGAVELAPHRALYKMKLASASRGSGVSGARGSMVYSFSDSCDAWASETNVKLNLLYGEGDEVSTAWSFASWESKDGKSYRFRIRHSRDGAVVESLKGTVKRGKPGSAARAKFSEPADKVIELPAGTLFPTRHLIDLIEASQGGTPVFSRTVFDGASLDNPYEINAIITRDKGAASARGKSAAGKIAAAGLAEMPTKHVRMAFFPTRSRKAEPEFELGVDYRDDGVARMIHQDFGDFKIDLLPDKFEPIEKPDC